MTKKNFYFAFRNKCLANFSLNKPNSDILRPNIRLDADHKKISFLQDLDWADIDEFIAEQSDDAVFYLADDWIRYFLPAYLCLSLKNNHVHFNFLNMIFDIIEAVTLPINMLRSDRDKAIAVFGQMPIEQKNLLNLWLYYMICFEADGLMEPPILLDKLFANLGDIEA